MITMPVCPKHYRGTVWKKDGKYYCAECLDEMYEKGEIVIEEMKEKLSPNFFKTDKKEVEYRWQKNDVVDSYPGLHITIPVPEEKLELIFEIEKKMAELGIVFDSGYGMGCRDWEFDWSLQGKHFLFDEEKKKYVEIKRGREGNSK